MSKLKVSSADRLPAVPAPGTLREAVELAAARRFMTSPASRHSRSSLSWNATASRFRRLRLPLEMRIPMTGSTYRDEAGRIMGLGVPMQLDPVERIAALEEWVLDLEQPLAAAKRKPPQRPLRRTMH